MASGSVRSALVTCAPKLTAAIEILCKQWIAPLEERLGKVQFRPKQVNDAIWGTIELFPWEVALLDTPLLQRMRGVRQLGLAYLVFPGAVHDRLEHILGVVGAVDKMTEALTRQVERWNRDPGNSARLLPAIEPEDRYRLRLAALFHDLGHGPFSHAIEPVLQVVSPLGTPQDSDGGWRSEISSLIKVLKSIYELNESPSVSEVLATLIVMSDAIGNVFSNQHLIAKRWATTDQIQEQIVACIVGAVSGPGADRLSTIISSQLDADRIDYLSRDAHHAGLAIGFDTDRLLSKLEMLQMRDDNTPGADDAMRARFANSSPDPVLQIGVSASGFGSFEQMLIGRTFLYDRLYHHHKVRAAEAMAQRMLLVAERDRGRRFELGELFLPVGDETLLRIIAMEVTHKALETDSAPAAQLARRLLDRRLLHRAYAFRARLISTPPGFDKDDADALRNEQWRRLLKSLDTLDARYELGVEIYNLAMRAVEVLRKAEVDPEEMDNFARALSASGPEAIIVDLPTRKADSIRIWARYPDGALKVPEFSFNPVKWADAYDLQKRTGYVFCSRELVPVVALAAAIVFMKRFSLVMSRDADGYTKAAKEINNNWLPILVKSDLIDQSLADQLVSKRHSLVNLQVNDLRIPSDWIKEDPNFGTMTLAHLKTGLPAGLTVDDLCAFSKICEAMFAFVDMWMDGSQVSEEIQDENELQGHLSKHLRSRGLEVQEGTVAGGGKIDLFVEQAVLIENKWKDKIPSNFATAVPAAGIQGRRYAVALRSQIVMTVAALRIGKGKMVPERSKLVEVRQSQANDANRVELRFTIPYGAVKPSAEPPPARTH